jgi:hypothetical protein
VTAKIAAAILIDVMLLLPSVARAQQAPHFATPVPIARPGRFLLAPQYTARAAAGSRAVSVPSPANSLAALPPAPAGLFAYGDAGQVMLSWNRYMATGQTDMWTYDVYRAVGSGPYCLVGTTWDDEFLDRDPNLRLGVTYRYRIAAQLHGIEGPKSASLSVATSASRIDRRRAVRIAATFCRVVGARGALPPHVVYLGDLDYQIESRYRYWRRTWVVASEPGVTVCVDDQSGAITAYQKEPVVEAASKPATASEARISATQATVIARRVIAATAIQDVEPSPSEVDPPGRWGLFADNFAFIVFHRTLGGFRYPYDHVTMRLDSRTGALATMTAQFPSGPAEWTRVRVDSRQAELTARGALRGYVRANLPSDVGEPILCASIRLRLVSINGAWTGGHGRYSWLCPLPPRAAWVCDMTVGGDRTDPRCGATLPPPHFLVRVDAVTGRQIWQAEFQRPPESPCETGVDR